MTFMYVTHIGSDRYAHAFQRLFDL